MSGVAARRRRRRRCCLGAPVRRRGGRCCHGKKPRQRPPRARRRRLVCRGVGRRASVGHACLGVGPRHHNALVPKAACSAGSSTRPARPARVVCRRGSSSASSAKGVHCTGQSASTADPAATGAFPVRQGSSRYICRICAEARGHHSQKWTQRTSIAPRTTRLRRAG